MHQKIAIYVAVDKYVCIYCIVPIFFVDNLDDDKAKNVKLGNIENYLGNWQILN